MKFLIDAQLPSLICEVLQKRQLDGIHAKQLIKGNSTPDKIIIDIAYIEKRIVVTKDSDFYYSHITLGKPEKLLLIKTGNIKNKQLLNLIRINIDLIVSLFNDHDFLELTKLGVTIHNN